MRVAVRRGETSAVDAAPEVLPGRMPMLIQPDRDKAASRGLVLT